MLTAEERLLIGLKVLERFNPSLHLRRLRNSQPLILQDQSLEDDAGGCVSNTSVAQPPDNRYSFQNGGFSLPSLQMLLASTGPLAPYSVILGACEDGLPFLLDLTNPAPGALLVAGDQGSGKTRLVQAILSSAALMNTAEQVVFSIIAQEPADYLALSQSDSLQGILPADQPESRELIQSLAQLVDDRPHTGQYDPAIILVVDDLVSFSGSVHEEILSALYTVLRHGPRSRIWTIATLSAGQVGQVEGHVLQAFRTRLLGKVEQASLAAYLSGSEFSGAENLEPGYMFCVPFGEEWIRFWVCESD